MGLLTFDTQQKVVNGDGVESKIHGEEPNEMAKRLAVKVASKTVEAPKTTNPTPVAAEQPTEAVTEESDIILDIDGSLVDEPESEFESAEAFRAGISSLPNKAEIIKQVLAETGLEMDPTLLRRDMIEKAVEGYLEIYGS